MAKKEKDFFRSEKKDEKNETDKRKNNKEKKI